MSNEKIIKAVKQMREKVVCLTAKWNNATTRKEQDSADTAIRRVLKKFVALNKEWVKNITVCPVEIREDYEFLLKEAWWYSL